MALNTELFRFRVVRPIQVQATGNFLDFSQYTPPKPSRTHADMAERLTAGPRLQLSATGPVGGWLASFSSALALQGDLVTPAAAVALLPPDWQTDVASPDWEQLTGALFTSLTTTMGSLAAQPTTQPTLVQIEQVEASMRALRVQDVVQTLSTQAAPGAQQILVTAGDLQTALAFRPVILDTSLFPQPPAVELVRQPGITDLFVVKDEWNRYAASELCQVINVLPGETFETRQRHYDRTEVASSTTTEQSTSEQQETDTTQSSSLSESSSKDASLNIGANAQVAVSAQYGPVKVQTSAGAQLQSSQSSSSNTALTTANEVVQRAVKSVSQAVIEVQSSRTITGDSTSTLHKLENTGRKVTVGLYRWLTEIHRCQVEQYPNRFVLEFELPEPGAWLRWALENQPPPGIDTPNPGTFTVSEETGFNSTPTPVPLNPSLVTVSNYQTLAAQWQVPGLTPPPPQQMTLSVVLTSPPSNDTAAADYVEVTSDSSLSVPTGYQADSWTASVSAIRDNSNHDEGSAIIVSVGGSQTPASNAPAPQGQQDWVVITTLSGQLGPAYSETPAADMIAAGDGTGYVAPSVAGITSGVIPISVYATAVRGFTIIVNVTCDLMPEAYLTWQQGTFDQLAAGYQAMLSAYQNAVNAAQAAAGGAAVEVGPPELNQQRATAELRRLVIEELIQAVPGHAGSFQGEPGVSPNPPQIPAPTEPAVDPVPVDIPTAQLIQFFEQAFEWENIVYICYPYYWSRYSQWVTNALSATADPVFDQFLNAGSARVVVPARPGFESMVQYFIQTGQIWNGSQPPAVNDPDYLSVAAEIQALQTGATDGSPYGSSWEVALPTTLLWAGSDPTTLPTNPSPTIPAPTPLPRVLVPRNVL